jgi:S-formylglutathione hydrolase
LNITGDSDNWDFGVGAGFYLDATREPWNRNYKMYTYITKELPAVLKGSIGHVVDTERASVCGHSMGGHGALTIYLKNPQLYRSVSAFAPICHPSQCPWGRKAFSGYLSDESQWAQYDATELLKGSQQQWSAEVLIDQGTEDVFHKRDQQLLPQDFLQAAKSAQLKVCYREQEGYDHGYYFISTFIDDHIRHHSKALK